MDSYNNNNSINVNINNDVNCSCNISQILNSIRNKKDARWFCLMNSKLYLF